MEWNDKFELRGGFDLMSDIQDYIEYIIIKYETSPTNPTHIYINRTNNKLVFKIKKNGYKLELQKLETIRLFGGTKMF